MTYTEITDKVHLGPGHVIVTDKPTNIWMVLGSCVSIILYDESSRTIAACHAQLPKIRQNEKYCIDGCPSPCYNDQPEPNTMKFLECAFAYMLRQLKKRNIPVNRLSAILLGGSNIFQIKRDDSIGEQNAALALQLLKENRIPIRKKDIGGEKGRTIRFYSETGDCSVKMQRSISENELFFINNSINKHSPSAAPCFRD